MDVTVMETAQKLRDASRANKAAADVIRSALHGHYNNQHFEAQLTATGKLNETVLEEPIDTPDVPVLSYNRATWHDYIAAYLEMIACLKVWTHTNC